MAIENRVKRWATIAGIVSVGIVGVATPFVGLYTKIQTAKSEASKNSDLVVQATSAPILELQKKTADFVDEYETHKTDQDKANRELDRRLMRCELYMQMNDGVPFAPGSDSVATEIDPIDVVVDEATAYIKKTNKKPSARVYENFADVKQALK